MAEDEIKRRKFLKQGILLSAGIMSLHVPAIAGQGPAAEPNGRQVPLDKNLDPAWVQSLYQRGLPTAYLKSRNELEYIGMPVGGITCGTVYLGGDGRLWLWDIFNKNQEGIDPRVVNWKIEGQAERKIRSRDGAAYLQPAKDIRPLDQGFVIHVEHGGKSVYKRLQLEDWEEISFEATYPIATVHYADKDFPVEVVMEVYSPFIPLDADDSGLPATIFSFRIKNRSGEKIKAVLTGFLENKTAIYSAKPGVHQRVNTTTAAPLKAVQLTVMESGEPGDLLLAPDYGSMCLASFDTKAVVNTNFTAGQTAKQSMIAHTATTHIPASEKLLAAVTISHELAPLKSVTSEFVISWFFPNLLLKGLKDKGRYYSTRFNSAYEVAAYIKQNIKKLSSDTRLFKQTWYDSTFPHWFLERTLSNITTLATTTCHRFTSGRFYGWEGVGSCEGTCTHVWHYAQAVGRLFPALERDTRSRVDLGIAMQENGGIIFRGEFEKRPAIDGQAGTVLRIYREHRMSTDDRFLNNNWTRIKKAIQFIINQDRNQDGMEDTPMENTLDAVWDGEIAWIVGLCIAAVSAGKQMATEMKDTDFETVCDAYIVKGTANMEDKLFNGEYFIHRPDAVKGRAKLGSYNTCHIDQVLGQSWAFQVGIDRILSKEKTLSALRSLWKYNFTTDVGPYIKTHPGGRPYALPGEGGMIMNTNPANEAKAYGEAETWQLGYFHECMTGFEHQVASHMMAEGMTDESLILTRTIHDRYHASKRNPFNEIECSDHYARAMASYGTFVSACGFSYHGPMGFIGFAPAWDADDFKAPFITAEGWGSFTQQRKDKLRVHVIHVNHGSLILQNIQLKKNDSVTSSKVEVTLGGKPVFNSVREHEEIIVITLDKKIRIESNQQLRISVG